MNRGDFKLIGSIILTCIILFLFHLFLNLNPKPDVQIINTFLNEDRIEALEKRIERLENKK